MAYNTIGFKDGSTPLDMANFNKMDEQIKANADDIDGLRDTAITGITVNGTAQPVKDNIADITVSGGSEPAVDGETLIF